MLTIHKKGILLQKTHLNFENEAVLNPGVIKDGEFVHLFYRAVRKGNHSTIGYCKLKGPFTIIERLNEPLLFPEIDFESQGIEDPRIVKIDDLYYLTYTAYDGVNALGALAISKDLKHFDKMGLIVPLVTCNELKRLIELQGSGNEKYLHCNFRDEMEESGRIKKLVWDKNVIFFPRRINGKLYFMHRIKPDIQIVININNFEELTTEFWQDYLIHMNDNIILTPRYKHEIKHIGGGCPPIETRSGWLLIYHSVYNSLTGPVYSACAALLDLQNPTVEISRLPYPLFQPEKQWEIHGEVNNVCFPTGTALFEDTLYIYYGAANKQIAYATVSLEALLNELMLFTSNKPNKSVPGPVSIS